MHLIDELMIHNKEFVQKKEFEPFTTTKYPNKKIVILTCMDTRLVELLPKAINVKNGDVKIVKNAGAMVSHPFGSVMRSLLVAVYALKAEEVLIIAHHDCGMSNINPDEVIEEMKKRNIKEEAIDTMTYAGIDLKDWLKGFDCVKDNVLHSIHMVKKHPLMPKDIKVHGLIIDPANGELEIVHKDE